MRICIPIAADRGLASPISGCFGAAPAFLVVDTHTGSHRVVWAARRPDGPDAAAALAALEGVPFDGVVVRGIGREGLRLLHAADLLVYETRHESAGAAVAAWRAGTLRLVPGRASPGAGAPLTDAAAPPECPEAPRAPSR